MDSSALIAEVKAFRAHVGASGSHFARIIGISPQGWAKKEAGLVPIVGHELARIARHYGTPMSEAFPAYTPTDGEMALAAEISRVA